MLDFRPTIGMVLHGLQPPAQSWDLGCAQFSVLETTATGEASEIETWNCWMSQVSRCLPNLLCPIHHCLRPSGCLRERQEELVEMKSSTIHLARPPTCGAPVGSTCSTCRSHSRLRSVQPPHVSAVALASAVCYDLLPHTVHHTVWSRDGNLKQHMATGFECSPHRRCELTRYFPFGERHVDHMSRLVSRERVLP